MPFFSLIGKPSPQKFAKLIINQIRRTGYTHSITFDPDRFRIYLNEKTYLYLNNPYNEFLAADLRGRRNVLLHYASLAVNPMMSADIPKDFQYVKDHVLPRPRNRAHYALLELNNRLDENTNIQIHTQDFTEHLKIELCYDIDELIMTISQDHLDQWGKSFEQVLAIARDNLWSISNEPFDEISPGFYLSNWQDTHDATRIILHDLIWQLKVKGDHVITIPDRNHCLVAGADDPDALSALAAATRSILLETDRPKIGYAHILNGTKWEPYLPPIDHPAYNDFKDAQLFTQINNYEHQRLLLTKLHNKNRANILVSPLQYVKRSDTTPPYTATHWPTQTPAMIPQTDKIIFATEQSNQVHLVDWHRAQNILAHHMTPIHYLYPIRYQIEQFPTPEELHQLGISF